MTWLKTLRGSLLAALAVVVLTLLTLGALGAALYYPVAPLLAPFYGLPDDWIGDWVWPSMIGAGLLWAAVFPLAGWVNLRLVAATWRPWPRRLIYMAVLWVGAALIWGFLLATRHSV